MDSIMRKAYWAETIILPIPAHTILWVFLPVINSMRDIFLITVDSHWKDKMEVNNKLPDVKSKRHALAYTEKLRERFIGNLALGFVAIIVMFSVTRC
jgi:hypothetical protein